MKELEVFMKQYSFRFQNNGANLAAVTNSVIPRPPTAGGAPAERRHVGWRRLAPLALDVSGFRPARHSMLWDRWGGGGIIKGG